MKTITIKAEIGSSGLPENLNHTAYADLMRNQIQLEVEHSWEADEIIIDVAMVDGRSYFDVRVTSDGPTQDEFDHEARQITHALNDVEKETWNEFGASDFLYE